MEFEQCVWYAENEFVVVVPLNLPPALRQMLINRLWAIVAAAVLRQEG